MHVSSAEANMKLQSLSLSVMSWHQTYIKKHKTTKGVTDRCVWRWESKQGLNFSLKLSFVFFMGKIKHNTINGFEERPQVCTLVWDVQDFP